MSLISRILLSTAIVSAPCWLFGQKSWTLEDCINHAMQNSIQLKRSILQVESVQKDLTQSAFEMGPNLSGFFNHQYINGTSFNQYTLRFENLQSQGGSLGIASEVTLFDGFYGFNNHSRLKYQLQSRKEDTEILKNNITLNVVAGFLQVLLDTENLKLAQEQYEVSKKHLEKAEAELGLGRISQGDYLNLKAQSINQKAIATNAQNRLNYSTIELGQLLELDGTSDFKIEVSPITLNSSHQSTSFDALYKEILVIRPEIRKASLDFKIAKKGLNMSYGLLSPRLSIGYQLGSGYDQSAWYVTPDSVFIQYPNYTYSQQVKDYVQHRLYFRLSVPIFQRLSNHTQISKSKIQVLDAQYAMEQAEKLVYKDIQSAFADAQASWDNYLAYSESVESYKELFNQTVKRFELGMVSALDVGVSQNNLVKAEGELLHAKYSYLLKVKILDFYRGVPITL
jgi:outer membrane protein